MSVDFPPKGHPPILSVETKKERVNMISALSSSGDVRYMLYEDSMNQQRLITFMHRLIHASKKKVFLILDNLKVHHGKMVAEWISRHPNEIRLFFLPPYAHPDEYLNHGLKLSVHSGDLPVDCSDIRHKANSFMRSLQRNKDKVRAFFRHPLLSYTFVQG